SGPTPCQPYHPAPASAVSTVNATSILASAVFPPCVGCALMLRLRFGRIRLITRAPWRGPTRPPAEGPMRGSPPPCPRTTGARPSPPSATGSFPSSPRSEEHTSELQSPAHLVCR